MKRALIILGFCVLWAVTGFASEFTKTRTNTKKSINLSDYTIPNLPKAAQPKPEPATPEEFHSAIPEGHVDQIQPDRSSGDPVCPEMYYCVARLAGTSIYCQWDNGNISRNDRDCNKTAQFCRDCAGHTSPNDLICPQEYYDKHCK